MSEGITKAYNGFPKWVLMMKVRTSSANWKNFIFQAPCSANTVTNILVT